MVGVINLIIALKSINKVNFQSGGNDGNDVY